MSQVETNDQAYTIRHPKKRSTRFFKFSPLDGAWTVFYCGMVVLAFPFVDTNWNRLFVAVAGGLWIVSMLWVESVNDRVYFAPIAALDNLRIRLNKNYTWKAEDNGKRRRKIRILKLVVQAFNDLGLIYNRKRDTYSIGFMAEGSPITSLNLAGQFVSLQQLASIFVKAAAAAKVRVEVAMGVRARPDDPWEFWDMIATFGELEVAFREAEATNKPFEAYTDYDHRMKFVQDTQFAQQEILDVTNDFDMILLVTVAGTEAFKKAVKKKEISEEEFVKQPIIRIRSVVHPLLEKLVGGNVTVFGPEDAERYLKKSYDVANLPEYYDRAHDRTLKGGEITPDEWYPQKFIKQFKDYVQIDDTYGATLKVVGEPHTDSFPSEGQVFYASHARYFANGVIGETQHGRWTYNFLNLGSGIATDAINQIGVDKSGPRAERREREADERLREIDQSVYIQDYVPLVAVSASSLQELEENVEKEVDRLTAEGIQTLRVVGERNQLRWYMTATTLIDQT